MEQLFLLLENFRPALQPIPHSRRRTFTKKEWNRKIGFRPSNSHSPEGKQEMESLFLIAAASEEAMEMIDRKPIEPLFAAQPLSRRRKTVH
jgi:hypothetical protein